MLNEQRASLPVVPIVVPRRDIVVVEEGAENYKPTGFLRLYSWLQLRGTSVRCKIVYKMHTITMEKDLYDKLFIPQNAFFSKNNTVKEDAQQ